jgi:hypothetical protein
MTNTRDGEVPIGAGVPQEMKDALIAAAAHQDRTVAHQLRAILREWLTANGFLGAS